MEDDDVVDAVYELGPEYGLDLLEDFLLHLLVERLFLVHVRPLGQLHDALRADVGRHDEERVLKVDGFAVAVGQAAVVHHLQEDIEDVRVGLLYFIQ